MSEPDSHATFEAPELEEVAALFPNYDLHGLIACGGMGAVYYATQRSLDRGVAIKILPREFSQDDAFREGFEAEAKAMAKLNHPNLIGVYDFGEAGGMLYIVMEYVAGNSLYAAAHGLAVERSEALKIVISVCRGLAHAHEYGILHRDIKPSNILLDNNNNPKVGDFGLARALESQIQEGEQIFGTPGYTAPEVIEPPFTFDHRADIFSVGVMLCELLTGITPDGQGPLPTGPQVQGPRISAVIRRATHKDPNARYKSAEELAVELEKIAATASNPLLAGATSPGSARPYAPPKAIKKSSSNTGFLLICAAIFAAGVYYFFIKTDEDTTDSETITETVTDTSPEIVVQDDPTDHDSETDANDGTTSDNDSASESDDQDFKIHPETKPLPERRKTVAEEGVKPLNDVDNFFELAENIMKERIVEPLSAYRINIKANTESFIAKAKEQISKSQSTDSASDVLDAAMEVWEQNDYLMHAEIPAPLAAVDGMSVIYSQHLTTQNNFRNLFVEKLKTEQAVYIIGLEKQIGRYREGGDEIAIELLEKEIERVKAEPDYFEFIVTSE